MVNAQTRIRPRELKFVNLATLVEGDLKAPYSMTTTPRCRGGRYSIS